MRKICRAGLELVHQEWIGLLEVKLCCYLLIAAIF